MSLLLGEGGRGRGKKKEGGEKGGISRNRNLKACYPQKIQILLEKLVLSQTTHTTWHKAVSGYRRNPSHLELKYHLAEVTQHPSKGIRKQKQNDGHSLVKIMGDGILVNVHQE